MAKSHKTEIHNLCSLIREVIRVLRWQHEVLYTLCRYECQQDNPKFFQQLTQWFNSPSAFRIIVPFGGQLPLVKFSG